MSEKTLFFPLLVLSWVHCSEDGPAHPPGRSSEPQRHHPQDCAAGRLLSVCGRWTDLGLSYGHSGRTCGKVCTWSRCWLSGHGQERTTVWPYTLAPCLPAQVPYNMERIFWLLSGSDSQGTRTLMEQFERTQSMSLPKELHSKVSHLTIHASQRRWRV